MATYLQRTPSSTGNRQIFTYSAWVKRSKLGANTLFYAGANSATSGTIAFRFTSNDNLNVYIQDIGEFIITNRKFRDVSAWYHIVLAIDTTQATPDNRRKLYINGVQETSFSTNTEVNRNLNLNVSTSGQLQRIGTYADGSGNVEAFFGGSMSHIHFCDGTALAPTVFGETDSTTGEWKINTSPSFTLGTNGFTILKDGNTITDQSTNSNDFSLTGGTLTKTEDCPSNVFATLNVLERLGSNITISNGNTQFFNQASDWRTIISNLAFPNTGKFYAEMQVNEVSSAVQVGIMAQSSFVGNYQADLGTQGAYNSYAYMNTGQKKTNNSASNYGNSFSGGIIGIAVDMDNKNMYFSKDGVWQNSGNPESGATGTGAPFTDLQIDKDYCFAVASQGSNPKVSWNFGNGYFGTTAVSSAGTNASGNGIFEYNVPAGYTALSTKGLNL